ncbi:tetratricopeptide repeat protein [Rivihabitans pingtungensis]|uniref:tetratricopeptide repeat protein n=1 Tax=Rivihabitans pingtungensis TaxID=1054498 RepID=UPI00235465CA|nr:hypothetical protein [Rivihabitans pingtungensis]MCK6436851.1 hypothetical protein [Rivihabitans pingtungensis]
METNARELIDEFLRPDLIGLLSRAGACVTLLWICVQFADVALDGLQKDLLSPTLLEEIMRWGNENLRTYKVFILGIVATTLMFIVEFLAASIRTGTRAVPPPVTVIPQPTDPYAVIVDYANDLNHQNHFGHFFRVYDAFSRHLWLEGCLETRVKLGKCAEEAAARSGDDARLIQVLIDDLGWTNVALRRYDAAKDAIRRGVEKANALGFSFWAAKGLRHLAGIATLEHNHDESLKLLAESEGIAGALPDSGKRVEMLTGIEYAKATTLLRQRKPSEALASIERFSTLASQSGDKTRHVRVFAIKGQAYLLANKWSDAKEAFIKGLKAAEEMGRADEVIRNHRGLAECYRHFGDKDQMAKHVAKAEKLESETPVPFEIEAK